MTQEFHLSVTPVGNNEYLVRTERVEPGVPLAEEQVTWPIERWLQQARVLMQDPLLQMLQADGSGSDDREEFDGFSELGDLFQDDSLPERRSRSLQDLVSLGKELYDALFCDSLRDRWMMAQAIAQNHQSPLRLRLGLKSAELNRLPWEALHDADRPLAAGTQLLFSRYRPSHQSHRPHSGGLAPGMPLRILMAISAPSDRAELALMAETRKLVGELQASPKTNIHFDLLEQPDRHTLTQALEGGHYNIFHYSGHSTSGRDGGEISLVHRKHGLTETLSGNDLAGMLANNGIQLAVFNSCRGAHRDGDADDSGAYNLAEAAIERHIPAVLAMAERIPDDVALSLTQLFYRNISQGQAIDLSLSRARQGLISSFGSRQFYWALPVFYFCPEFDGLLFDRVPSPEQAWSDFEVLEAAEPELLERPDFSTPPRVGPPSEPAMPTMPAVDRHPPLEMVPSLAEGLLPDRLPEDEPIDLSESTVTETPRIVVRTAEPAIRDADRDSPAARVEASEPASAIDAATIPRRPTGRQLQADASPREPAVSKRQVPAIAIGLAATVVSVAVAIGTGLNWGQPRTPTAPDPNDPQPAATMNSGQSDNGLSSRELETLVNRASTAIAQRNFAAAMVAIAQLLDEKDLPRAQALLDSVPTDALDWGDVQFQKGRWAWQTRVSGNLDASYDDAQSFWKYATEADADNLLYLTALGWAHYAADEFDEADRAWRLALRLNENNPQASVSGSSLDRLSVELSMYAGLALLLERRGNRELALEFLDFALDRDALVLLPDRLARNWLWTAEAIGEWQTLRAAPAIAPASKP